MFHGSKCGDMQDDWPLASFQWWSHLELLVLRMLVNPLSASDSVLVTGATQYAQLSLQPSMPVRFVRACHQPTRDKP